MADTSSDDEIPLAQRPSVAGFGLAAAHKLPDSSDSDSDFPSWLQTGAGAGQKANQVVDLTDSDSDDAVLSPAKPAAAVAAAATATPAPAGNRDVQQPATQQKQDTKATGSKAAAPPKSVAKQRAAARGQAAAAATAAAAIEAAGPSQPPPSEPPTQPPLSQPATQPGGTGTRRAPALGLPHAPTSSMPLVLPEKLPHLKMLVELESNPDDAHGVTDLSGDSGAIGRLLVAGTKDEPQLQIDLKGVLYNATIVPCPMSVAVINMGQSEAKVECLFSEFVQIREDTRFSFVDMDQLGGMVGGDDDDDGNFAGGPGGDDGAGEGGGAKKGEGRGKVAAAGTAKPKAAPRKRAAPKAKGGVKKGGGKPKAKPKPKPKAAAKKNQKK